MIDPRDRLPFRSVFQTVKWAAGKAACAAVPVSKIYEMGPMGCDVNRLPANAKAAQAGRIKDATLELLAPIPELKAYVECQFFGDRTNMAVLKREVAEGLPSGVPEKALEKIVLSYLGQPIGHAALRLELRCRMATAIEYKRIGFDRLDRLHARAEAILLPLYDERGWIRLD